MLETLLILASGRGQTRRRNPAWCWFTWRHQTLTRFLLGVAGCSNLASPRSGRHTTGRPSFTRESAIKRRPKKWKSKEACAMGQWTDTPWRSDLQHFYQWCMSWAAKIVVFFSTGQGSLDGSCLLVLVILAFLLCSPPPCPRPCQTARSLCGHRSQCKLYPGRMH